MGHGNVAFWFFGGGFDVNMKYVLSVIDELRDEWYKPPMRYYHRKRADFEYQSYKRSAMDEIKFYLMEHENEDPVSAVEEFRYMMNRFACETKNGGVNFMFSIYYDVATDILDVLLGMK